MRILTLLFLTIIITRTTQGQVQYLDSNYNSTFSKLPELYGKVKFITSKYFYLQSVGKSKPTHDIITQYSRVDFKSIWSIAIQDEFKLDGVKFSVISKLFKVDGTIIIFAGGYDTKFKSYKIYLQYITEIGEKSELKHLVDIPLKTDKFIGQLKVVESGHYMFASFITEQEGIKIINGIWINKELGVEKVASTNVVYEEVAIKKLIKSKNESEIFVLASGPTSYINNRIIEPKKGIYRFRLEEGETRSIPLQFEDFKIFENQVDIDTISNSLLLVGLSGQNKTNKINSIINLKIDVETLKIENISFNPISDKAFDEVARSGKILGTSNKNLPKVQFQEPRFIFCTDGSYYVDFPNIIDLDVFISMRQGDYILKFDKNNKLVWDIYLPSYGEGRNQLTVVDNELIMSTLTVGRWLKKLYPNVEEFNNLSNSNFVLLNIVLNSSIPEFEITMILNSEELPARSIFEEFDAQENIQVSFITFFPHTVKQKDTVYLMIAPK